MGRFDGIIIVSDIDGTFLGKGSRMVPENLEAIEYFQAEGGRFTIATGREIMNIPSVIPDIGDICNAPVIACNGACIWDARADRVLLEEFLPEPDAFRIALAARSLCPETGMRISIPGEYWTERLGEMTGVTFRNMLPRFRTLPLHEMKRGCWYKIAWDGTPDELERVRGVLAGVLGEECVFQLGHSTILEIQSRRATKGAMLSRLKSLVGCENGTLWAVGDYENDYTLLAMADRCAVPENGMDMLKNIPGAVVVPHHDEGAIAGLIRRIETELTERGDS